MNSTPRQRGIATASLILLGSAIGFNLPAEAQTTANQQQRSEAGTGVQQQIARAATVIEQMKADPKLAPLLKRAQGIFVVPAQTRGGLIVAGRGGKGVMLARQGQEWTSPLFYNLGGISIGLQAGVERGPVAMLLMNEKAVNEFRKENNFALDANAGLTLVNYNAAAVAGASLGDVVVWTNTKGAFGAAAIGVLDIHFDDSDNRAYYGKPVKASDVLSGNVKDAQPGILGRSLKAVAAN